MDVCMISASGGELHFLAQTGSNERPEGLSWSPDGTELAFERWNGEKTDIFIVSVATRQVRSFTTDGKANTAPVWSGDGKRVTYLSRRGVGVGHRRWIQALEGGWPKILKVSKRDPLVYSPDGYWVAYFHSDHKLDSPKGFYASRVNTEGESSGRRVLLKAVNLNSDMYGRPMRWTSDGEIIISEEFFKNETYVLGLKSGEYRQVSLPPSLVWQSEPLRWLSDGDRLSLPSRPDQNPGLLNVQTGELTAIQISIPEGFQLGTSTFSPDGTRIAFVQQKFAMTPQGGRLFEGATLHITSVSGGPSIQLTHGDVAVGQPRWSPDGQRIAFLNVKGGGKTQLQLCVVSVDSGQVKRLSEPGLFGNISWSPDGKTLAYFRFNEGEKAPPHYAEWEGDVYVVPAAGGASRRITHSPEIEIGFAWTPDGKHLTFAIDKDPQDEHWVVSVEDKGLKKLQDKYIQSSWSSDGKTYLVYAYGKFQRVSLDGSISSEFSFPKPINANPFHMSPDGETILFVQGDDSNTQYWKIDVSDIASD